MNFLKNLSIRSKLILASLIPLLGLLYYLQNTVRADLAAKESAGKVKADVASITELSKVLHELQKERALALAFLSEGTAPLNDLVEQYQESDKALAELLKVQRDRAGILDSNPFDSLQYLREKVRMKKPVSEIDPYYITLKAELLNEVAIILRSTDNLVLKGHLEEHLLLLISKDFLASLRSQLGSAISRKGFQNSAAYGDFAASQGNHEFNLNRLKRIASPELKSFFLRKYQGPFIEQAYRVIDASFNDPSFQQHTFDFDTWWSVSTSAVNSLKEIEDYSIDLINARAEQILGTSAANVSRNLIIAAAVVLLIVAFVAFTVKGIVNSVEFIKRAADKMAEGDVSVEVNVTAKDEIAQLALSFNRMIEASREYSIVADAIGKGDYTPEVKVRSEVDILGAALDKMKTNLQQLSRDNETRTWLLSGTGLLNDKMRGEKDLKGLAQDVVTQIATYLKALIGAIYLNENGKLVLVGSYAFHERKGNTSSFRMGHGLVGQAALERKMIVFSEIPKDYIRINSGLGNAIPRHIIVFPFSYENEVKGVIELGTINEISPTEIQFLELAADNIGIAFNSSQSRDQMKDLLEETQRQAEELEVQQEELKQANEELQEKTVLLEKSESELKAQQEELQQTNEELEEKANLLEEQKDRLELAKMEIENKARELEATSKYKSEFLANMSHELRTPLNSILILSQLLAENKHNTLADKEVEFVKNIYNSGTDLLDLINEILDLSKVESGKMELDIAPVPFNELTDDMKSMFSEIARTKSIDFTIDINEKELDVNDIVSDKQRLKQILRNLLSNAFKFTEKNGAVTLAIGQPRSGTHFANKELQRRRDVIAFSVSDTGIGIPQAKQSIVFEAFQQAEGSTKRKYGGTGLGLSISRELANALGGEIHLQSEEGHGSTFTLYLPASFDALPVSPAKRQHDDRPAVARSVNPLYQLNKPLPSPTTTDGATADDRNDIHENDKLVLIIEDDHAFSALLLDFVRDKKYKGIIARQGNTGLSYARLYKPDAIILDMKLPVMDGLEVLKHLKNDPDLRHVPVQIISSLDMRREGIELGAFDFVKKPVTTESLQSSFAKVENFINRKLKRLLVVEDNETQNKAIRELIGNGDVKCFSAYSGKEAIHMLKSEKFDCIIVDLGLPDMVGLELLQKIKNDPELNQIPIVVYTGKDLTKEEISTLNRLASTVVLKTAHSFERLLDETTLFLHRVESKLPDEKQKIIRKLHKTDEVLKNKTVLVVDDDVRNTYSLTNALIEEGLNCLVAENGKSAIQILKENNNVDIVLMDVMMPEMDGYEATGEIRKISRFEKLPIVALTAKAMKGDRDKCLAAGMSDYVPKPVNVQQLLSLMRVWLYK